MKLFDLLAKFGTNLEVSRGDEGLNTWLQDVYTKQGVSNVKTMGNGLTVQRSLQNYVQELNGKMVVYQPAGTKPTEIRFIWTEGENFTDV